MKHPDVAICLLTADRAEMTALTLETFARFNRAEDYVCLHADDGSEDERNMRLAAAHGFVTGYRHRGPPRAGQIPALKAMISEACSRGCTSILYLENDQEFVGPIPERRDAQQIRLYGEYKARPGAKRDRASGIIWGTGEKARWRADGDGWERGVIHWGAQPSITWTVKLLDAVWGARKVHDIAAALPRLDTLRPLRNITFHADPGGTTPRHFLGKKIS